MKKFLSLVLALGCIAFLMTAVLRPASIGLNEFEGVSAWFGGDSAEPADDQEVSHLQPSIRAGDTPAETSSLVTGWLREQALISLNDSIEFHQSGQNSAGAVGYRQLHQGIPVFGAKIEIVEANQQVTSIHGSTKFIELADVEPAVELEAAWETASSSVEFGVIAAIPEALQVFDTADGAKLVWVFKGRGEGADTSVLVDAKENILVAIEVDGAY